MNKPKDQWVLLTETDGVKVYYQLSPSCAMTNSMFLRFENTTDEAKTATWTIPKFVIQSPLEPENVASISLTAHQDVKGECSTTAPLHLFWKFKENIQIPESSVFQITNN
ncbi:MAG: hypothetical protein IT244_05330 [Bacteroidia bacterium]|nr:hypothetical protein [Bacteroidia bacterium]